MKKFLLCISISLIAFQANASEGVVVNTNVLNSLTQTSSAIAPKFPIMPKRVIKPVIKKEPLKPIAKNPIIEKEVLKPVIAAPAEVAQPEMSIAQIKEQENLKKQFDDLPQITTEKETNKEAINAPAPTIEEHKPQTLELMPGAKVADIPEAPTEEKPTPIIGTIIFESFDAKLSDANKVKVDEIVSQFKDPINNKISIVAYNVEDGVDAFKKKRQVLDHALEVRNYLAQKGYNNLSLRVLSTKNDPSKINLVEISEL